MTINNRGLGGQPGLPYTDYRSYAGADVFIDLSFLDHTGVPVTPVSLVYQIDDLTNAVNIIPATNVAIVGPAQTLHIPGASLQMTHFWQGSEIFQIKMTMVYIDTSTGSQATAQSISVLELVAIQTPNSQ